MAAISSDQMREYETLFILRSEMDDTAAVEFITRMKGLVEKQGGKHIKMTNWGRKKLAWERDRHQKGMYVQHQYLGKPGIVAEYERNLGIAEDCILRQTIVVNKAVHADSRQPEEDVLQPPIQKEREERRPRRDDDDDRGYDDDRDHRRSRGRDDDDDDNDNDDDD